MMGAGHHAALLWRPVTYRKQTVSGHHFIYCQVKISYNSWITSVHMFVFLFQEGRSSQNHTALPLQHPLPPPLPPLTQAKKWAGRCKKKDYSFPTFSCLYLLFGVLPQRVWSRGWHIFSWRWRRAGRHRTTAGREAQGADEGSDFAQDVRHAGPQSHDREAGEGGWRVWINGEIPRDDHHKKRSGRSKRVNVNTYPTLFSALEIRRSPR